MSLRRHIAFVAVLVASAAMLVHAVVPHHRHGGVTAAVERSVGLVAGEEVVGAGCHCLCEDGAQCVAKRAFLLRYEEDDRSQESPVRARLPILVCDFCTGHGNSAAEVTTFQEKGNRLCFQSDQRLIDQWRPDATAGRAPPVLRQA